jgi:hypothetical protein
VDRSELGLGRTLGVCTGAQGAYGLGRTLLVRRAAEAIALVDTVVARPASPQNAVLCAAQESRSPRGENYRSTVRVGGQVHGSCFIRDTECATRVSLSFARIIVHTGRKLVCSGQESVIDAEVPSCLSFRRSLHGAHLAPLRKRPR